MAASVNRAIIIGRVGKDPTVRNTQGGAKIVSFSVATSETWKDKATGERKEDTTWHNVVVFNTRLADFSEKFVRKGVAIYVEGTIKNRKWTTNEGVDRYITEIVVPAFNGTLTLLTPPNGTAGSQAPAQQERPAPREPERTDPKGNPRYGGDLDDEIPF